MELKLLLLLAAMAANGHPREQLSPQGLRLCSQVTPGDLTTNLYNFREEFSDVVLVYDDNDELSRDLACLVNQLVPQARSSNLQPEHCMRLLTDPIELAGVFVLITHMPHKVPLCEAPVYGSLPSVIEVRITDTPKTYQNRFLTFNLIGNGGDLRFDVALGNSSETVKNLLLVYKTLFSIVITGRPWSNGFVEFHRRSHLKVNRYLAERRRAFVANTFGSEEVRRKSFRVQTFYNYVPLLFYASVVGFLLVYPFTSRRIEFDTIDIPLDTLSPPPEPPEPPPPPSSQMESTAMTTKATQEKASTSSEPVKTPSMELGTVNTLESKALEPVTFPRLEEQPTQPSTSTTTVKKPLESTYGIVTTASMG